MITATTTAGAHPMAPKTRIAFSARENIAVRYK
jgi:hypothetical protein